MKRYDIWARYLFLLAIFVPPLIFLTDFTRNPYFIQAVVFNILLASILAIKAIKFLRERKISPPRTVIDTPLAVFFLWCLVTDLYSFFHLYPQYRPSIFAFASRHLIFLLLNCIGIFYMTVRIAQDEGGEKKILFLLLGVGTLSSLYGVLQYLGIELIWGQQVDPFSGRSVSTFGNPNFLSTYLVLVIPIIVALIFSARSYLQKILFVVLCIVNMFGLFVTQTRSSWLGLFVSMLVMGGVIIVRHRDMIRKNARWIAVFLLLLALVTVFPLAGGRRPLILNSLLERIESIVDLKQQAYVQRFLIWSSAVSVFMEQPLTGCGWGNFEILYPFHQGKYITRKEYAPYRTHANNAHNEILEMLTQIGLAGLGLYIWVFLVFFREAFRVYRETRKEESRIMVMALIASIIGAFVDNMLNVSIHFPMPAVIFWINMGLIFGIGRSAMKGKPVRSLSASFPLRLAASVLALLFAGGVVALNVRTLLCEAHYFRGFKYARREANLARTADECLLAHNIYPLNVDNNYEMGNAYARLGQKEKAIWAYKEALKANPGYDEIYFNLGVMYMQVNKMAEAAAVLEESAAINPLYPDTHFSLGNVYIQQGQWRRSIEAYRACLELKPAYRMALDNLSVAVTQMFNEGESYVEKEDWDGAEKIYEDIVRLYPDDEKALLYLGNIYFKKKKLKEAVREYRRALEVSGGKNLNVMNNLGMAYMETGDMNLAAEEFKKVLRLDAKNRIAAAKLEETKKKH